MIIGRGERQTPRGLVRYKYNTCQQTRRDETYLGAEAKDTGRERDLKSRVRS